MPHNQYASFEENKSTGGCLMGFVKAFLVLLLMAGAGIGGVFGYRYYTEMEQRKLEQKQRDEQAKELAAELNDLESSHSGELDALKTESTSALKLEQASKSRLESRIQQLQTEKATLQVLNKQLIVDKKEGLDGQKILKVEIDSLESRIAEGRLSDVELKNKIKIKEAELNGVRLQLKILQKEKASLTESKEAATERSFEMNKELMAKNEQLQGKIGDQMKENTELAKAGIKKDSAIILLKRQIQDLEKEKSALDKAREREALKIQYYQKQYAQLIDKYDEVRDAYLEENPEQTAVDLVETQIFSAPGGGYKLLVEFKEKEGDLLDLGVAIMTLKKVSPRFDLIMYSAEGQRLTRIISVDYSRTSLPPGRVLHNNQGWKIKEGDAPKYFEILFRK
ncbi:hypothetical protein ACFL4W_03360 [Planctomycetota bacterium]